MKKIVAVVSIMALDLAMFCSVARPETKAPLKPTPPTCACPIIGGHWIRADNNLLWNIVQEELDGGTCAVARGTAESSGWIHSLGRATYSCTTGEFQGEMTRKERSGPCSNVLTVHIHVLPSGEEFHIYAEGRICDAPNQFKPGVVDRIVPEVYHR